MLLFHFSQISIRALFQLVSIVTFLSYPAL